MWLVTTAVAAILATILWRLFQGKYRLGLLSQMLWGATVMILVDFILGYKGGTFIETKTDGLIPNATLLGLVMLLPVVAVWLTALLVKNHGRNERQG